MISRPCPVPTDRPFPSAAPGHERLPILRGTRPEEGNALVINLFGGPGIGKSTLAARLFAGLKERGIEAACPEEHAKLAIWSGQPWLLDHQAILLGRTWETIQALHDKVDVVIIDSPLLLCSVYAGAREPDCFHQLCADLHRRSTRINVLIERRWDATYSERGRMQTVGEALRFDDTISQALRAHGETALPMCHNPERITALIEDIAGTVTSGRCPR